MQCVCTIAAAVVTPSTDTSTTTQQSTTRNQLVTSPTRIAMSSTGTKHIYFFHPRHWQRYKLHKFKVVAISEILEHEKKTIVSTKSNCQQYHDKGGLILMSLDQHTQERGSHHDPQCHALSSVRWCWTKLGKVVGDLRIQQNTCRLPHRRICKQDVGLSFQQFVLLLRALKIKSIS